MSWYNETLFYHIYPLGALGAPKTNEGDATADSRILQLLDWIPHFEHLGVGAVYIGPIFESAAHGYDTIDYFTPDRRLGTKDDFKTVFAALHEAGIRIVLDGVFNHVSRRCPLYLDVLEKKDASPYRWWFSNLNFGWGNPLGDEATYDTWGGDWNLVKLNLGNPDVRGYLLSAVERWMEDYDIDGLRLDTADVLNPELFRDLNRVCKGRKSDFWLMGEFMNCANCQAMQPDMLDSITNYECWKGMYSSCNSHNLYEISYGINRQTNPQWGMYKGKFLYNFLDNHDQTRIASQLSDPRHLPALYTMLLTMPGIPSIYCGSEWGIHGKKGTGAEADYPLRPALSAAFICTGADKDGEIKEGDASLMEHIASLSAFRKGSRALQYGSYTNVKEGNEQLVYAREYDGETVLVALNIADHPAQIAFSWNGRDYSLSLDAFAAEILE